MNLRFFCLALAAVSVTSYGEASATPCSRWRVGVTACQALNNKVGCDGTLNVANQAAFDTVRYQDTAPQACKVWIEYNFPGKTAWGQFPNPNDHTIYRCTYAERTLPNTKTPPSSPDYQKDFDNDYSGSHYLPDYVTNLTRESHCDCTVNGPHSTIDYSTQQGSSAMWVILGSFPPALKKAVLENNLKINGGFYKSDAPFDPIQSLQKMNPNLTSAAEIDHIIPRRDSKGCPCGFPGKQNAAVISRKMNGSMSNTSPLYNKDRAEMYKKWVTCPDPAAATYIGGGGYPTSLPSGGPWLPSLATEADEMMPIDFDEDERNGTLVDDGYLDNPRERRGDRSEQIPEDTAVTESSIGCSTTGSSNPLLMLALVGVFSAFRRRRQSSMRL